MLKKQMKTPYQFECQYFYGDYRRGKHHEECRLIGNQSPPNHWDAKLCKDCPVPGILRANACKNMVLRATVKRGFLGLSRKVVVQAYCNKVKREVKDPYIGCGECHPLPEIFKDISD